MNFNHASLRIKICMMIIGSLAFADKVNPVKLTPQDFKEIKLTRIEFIQRSHWDKDRGLISDEDYQVEKVKVLKAKRQALISQIGKLLLRSKEPATINLKFRLAKLHVEEYHFSFETKEQKAALVNARNVYSDILQKYPADKRLDECLYYIGMSYLEEDTFEKGTVYFEKLAKEYPKSIYVYESYLLMADHLFFKNQWTKSMAIYDQIITSKKAHALSYAMYRKAWCLYNMRQVPESLAQFYLVIKPVSDDKKGFTSLRREALKDIVFPLMDLKMVDEAIRLFRNEGDPVFHDSLSMFASLYTEAGNYEDGIKIWKLLIAADASHPSNIKYDLEIIKTLRAMNKPEMALRRLYARAPIYKENASYGEFELLAKNYALEYHQEAQGTKNPKIYEMTRFAYTKYLEQFESFPTSNQIRFNLAEVLFQQQQYKLASENYYITFEKFTSLKQKQLSLWRCVSSIYEELNVERKQNKATALSTQSRSKLTQSLETSLVQTPFSPIEQRFIKFSTLYLKKYPKAPEYLETQYVQSYLKYIHFDFDNALEGFENILRQPGQNELKYTCALITLDIQNRIKAYKNLVARANSYLTDKNLTKKEFKAEVSDILRHSILKLIQIEESEGEFLSAAKNYEKYVKDYGKDDLKLTEKARYNAAINYEKANDFINAQRIQEDFITQYPKNALIKDLLLKVGKRYESWADFKKASFYLERFATDFEKDIAARDALRLAAIYSWGAGHKKKALQMMDLYISKYPLHSELVKADKVEFLNQKIKVVPNPLLTAVSTEERKFMKIKLTGKDAQLGRAMKKKIALLKVIEQKYSKIIASKESHSSMMQSFSNLATNYHHFAEEILNAQVPMELSAQELENYRKEISKQFVLPFREKAKSFASLCLKLMEDKNILSPITAKCYEVISQIDPENYPSARTMYLPASVPLVIWPGNTTSSDNEIKRVFPDETPEKSAIVDSVRPMLFIDPTDIAQPPRSVATNSDEMSFKDLNALRLSSAITAVPVILKHIKKDSNNIALHNLLGLTYLQIKNFPAAKAVWYSLVARGIKSNAVSNNLGIIAILEGKDEIAHAYFDAAIKQDYSLESWLNLGNLALKYRHGKLAQDCFRQAMHNSENKEAGIGFFIASIQLRDWTAAKTSLYELGNQATSSAYLKRQIELFKLRLDEDHDEEKQPI